MVIAAVLGAFLAQFQIGPDEVRVRSAPYYPLGASSIIRTTLDLVEVPVVVRDNKGHAIANLKRENFEITDAGKPRAISTFNIETFSPTGATAGPAPTESKTPE